MKTERTAIFTRKVLKLDDAVENGTKKEFAEKLREHALSLHNCSVGDSFLAERYNSVLLRALEKFL